MTEFNLPITSSLANDLPTSESESFTRSVARNVFRRATARIGLAWIGILVICAVFAPFLCTSHPLLMEMGGHWSSPLLRHLAPADVILQIAFWAAAVLYILPRMSVQRRCLVWFAILFVSIVLCPLTIHPPQIVVYESYRVDQQAGHVQLLR